MSHPFRCACGRLISVRARPIVVTLILLYASLAPSSMVAAVTLPDPVTDATAIPYRDVGYITTPGARGTGFVAHHRAIGVTAAHLFVDGGGNSLPDDHAWWIYPLGRNNNGRGPGKPLRTHVVYTGGTGYAAMVLQFGQNSAQALNQDIAVVYGYENLADYDPPTAPTDSIQRLRSNRPKMIVGYAGSFYQDRLRPFSSPDAELLHATQPTEDRYDGFGEAVPYAFYVNSNSTRLLAAPGGSGSPLYIRDNDAVWLPAGVVVAAEPQILLTPDTYPPVFGGAASVRAFRQEDIAALITPLLPQFTSAPTITLDLPAASAAIIGDTVVLRVEATGWGTLAYQWLKNGQTYSGGTNAPELTLHDVDPSDAGTYSVRVSNANGAVTSRGHVLTIPSAPVITSHPSATSVSFGNAVSLSVAFRAEEPFSIQWLRNDQPVSGATSAVLSIEHATFLDEGTYRVRVSNGAGEALSNTAAVTVAMGPDYLGSIHVHQGIEEKNLILAPTSAPELATTYQWSRNGQPIAGATDRVLNLGIPGPGEYGSYTLTITHPRGNLTSSAVLVSEPSTIGFTDPAMVRRLRLGDVVELGRHLRASAVSSYQWLKDNQAIPGATAPTLSLTLVDANSFGEYTLEAMTPQGTLTSESITVLKNSDEFWSEIPLPTFRPARSGGIVAGQVLLFGDRWRAEFAAGSSPNSVESWWGASDFVDFAGTSSRRAAIALLPDGDSAVYTSSASGDWQSQKPFNQRPPALTFGNGLFVAGPLHRNFGSGPWRHLTSADGLTWSAADAAWTGAAAPANWINASLAFGGGRFTAVDEDCRSLTSTQGTTWTSGATGAPFGPVDLAYEFGRFVRSNGTSTVSYSTNGSSWTETPILASADFALLEIVAGDAWFAARSYDGQLALSRDGTGWEVIPSDDVVIRRLVGIAAGRLYAIRADGVPLVSRPLGSIAVVRQPTTTWRLAGSPGSVQVVVSGEASDLSFQWYRGTSGDTSNPIAGATGPSLSVPADDDSFEAWVRISDGTESRDTASGMSRDFEPGYFFSDNGTYRTAALVRADGSLTVLASGGVRNPFLHLRKGAAFSAASTFDIDFESMEGYRDSADDSMTVTNTAPGLDLRYLLSSAAVLGDATRVAGTRPAGYYRGGVMGELAAELDALLCPDGRAIIGLHTPTQVLHGEATIAEDGTTSLNFGEHGQVALTFNDANGRFTGTWTRPGVETPARLRGVREGTDAAIVLVNLSGRAFLPAAGRVAIGGFTVHGTGKQRILARGVGPGLRRLGVNDAAAHPTLRLFKGQTQIMSNTGWVTDPRADEIEEVGSQLYAFALRRDEADSALLAELDPGSYTFHILDPTGAGTTLAELYFDHEYSGNGRLINISTRGWVDNQAVVIAGFVITGNGPRQILLRGIGPTLSRFGVTDPAPAVEIELWHYRQETRQSSRLLQKRGWTQLTAPVGAQGDEYMRDAMASVFAFSLPYEADSDDEDAAMLVWLDPGIYTLQVRLARGTGGTALAEVYDVPFDAAR